MRKPKYKLYDEYQDKEFIGNAETIEGVRTMARKRDEETGGEWSPVLYEKVRALDRYGIKHDWKY